MVRWIHRWPGLLALPLVAVLTLSGAALSIFPVAERLAAPQADDGMNVAALAARIQAAHPGVEQIRRSASGSIVAYWSDGGGGGSGVIDPASGKAVAPTGPAPVQRWLKDLHRSLFLDDGGRAVTAVGAAAMLVLVVSGSLLAARRAGGWARWFAPLRGRPSGRVHIGLARLALPGLLLSSATALWMTASTFGLLPDQAAVPAPPAATSGRTGAPLSGMPLLASTPVASLRRLSFPDPGDTADVFTLKTDLGTGYIDQGTGATLGWSEAGGWARAAETVYMLHTGDGAALLGLLLGAAALAGPAIGISGLIAWLGARRGRPRIAGNAAPSAAETVILVASEGGTTWGFAAALHAALRRAGQRVRTAPITSFDPACTPSARRYLILAATCGAGDAPASASGFLRRLAALPRAPAAPLAVLGFGDRGFAEFCAFAAAIDAGARAKGWDTLLPFGTVDRQSAQEFARWGRALGAALGIELDLGHGPAHPATVPIALVSRRDYGREMQAPTTILRFALPPASLWQRLLGQGFADFEAGDLIGVVPEGSSVPRFYSLASGRADGFIEIVVRKHAGGLCSGVLTALEPGATVAVFLRRNPGFRAGTGRGPLILVGAGTGIGPLAGFIRANAARRPIRLFFGMRHPDSDFLYREELAGWAADGRLACLSTASSREARPHYVQDALACEHRAILAAIRDGARVMVCGGTAMAAGVAQALARMLESSGTSLAALKAEGRYVEDVY